MIPLGKSEKMLIQAYTDADCIKAVGEYELSVNPESFSNKYQLDLKENPAIGSSGTTLKYNGQLPNEWGFDILIDGTGIIKNTKVLGVSILGAITPLNVDDEVKKLTDVVLNYNSEIHRSNFLKICWGSNIFKGSLISLDLDYKLFDNTGKPLRVIAKLKLKEWISDKLRIAEEKSSSPDITHQRMIKAGDKFTLMVYDIYNDSKYYLDVARANKLDSFRKVPVGTEIIFPPLK
ncbi:MAG: LysM peptidoglycan-binding domain-containing protein [Ignavibacteriae bacterium]|nr:MAG: LysM peptidoglycan-binding domain-containing protein [Ignavibacteriota bacterium]